MIFRCILILFIFTSFSCDQPTRSGYVEQKTLRIKGRVVDFRTNQPLDNAVVYFYADWETEGYTTSTAETGYYLLTVPDVHCEELVGTPAEFDPNFFAIDRYFISATKLGYDTVTIGAFAAGIHCFDFTQQVNFKISHLNYYVEEVVNN